MKMPAKLYDFIVDIEAGYVRLPIKLRLFLGMLVAANTAALAMYLSARLADFSFGYHICLGAFLAYRVCAFMANPNLKLTDENVYFMSSERTLWNVATIAVLITMIALKHLAILIF